MAAVMLAVVAGRWLEGMPSSINGRLGNMSIGPSSMHGGSRVSARGWT